MIRRKAVGFQQHLVVDVVVRESDVAAKLVAEGGLAVHRNFEANDAGAALRPEGGDLRGGQFAVGSVVARRQLGGELRFTHRLQFFGCLEAAIGVAGIEQKPDVLAINLGSLRLAIRTVRAANVGTFVPGEPEPAKRVEDHLLGGGDETSAVGVLDAQDELAAALASVDEVEQANVRGANVRVAGGRRDWNSVAYG